MLIGFRLDCSYGSRIKQARGATYVVHLERRVEELQNRMDYARDIDARRSSLPFTQTDSRIADQRAVDNLSFHVPDAISPYAYDSSPNTQYSNVEPAPPFSADAEYVETIGWPEGRPESSLAMPYGKACGFEVLRRMRALCSDVVQGSVYGREDPDIEKLLRSLDYSISVFRTSAHIGPVTFPAEADTWYYLESAFAESLRTWPFIERSAVEAIVYRQFRNPDETQEMLNTEEDIALLYIILAIGLRSDTSSHAVATIESGTPNGSVVAG